MACAGMGPLPRGTVSLSTTSIGSTGLGRPSHAKDPRLEALPPPAASEPIDRGVSHSDPSGLT